MSSMPNIHYGFEAYQLPNSRNMIAFVLELTSGFSSATISYRTLGIFAWQGLLRNAQARDEHFRFQ